MPQAETPLDCVKDNPNHIQNDMATMIRSQGGRTATELGEDGMLRVGEAPMTFEMALRVTQALEKSTVDGILADPFYRGMRKGSAVRCERFRRGLQRHRLSDE